MNKKMCFLVVVAVLFAETSIAQNIQHIDVFAEFNNDKPTSPDPKIVYWDLAAPEKIKSRYLPNNLSSNPDQAKEEFSQFIASPEGKKFVEAMKDSYQPMVEMAKLRVTKTPAIVIDKKYVIYGTTDISTAVTDYQRFIQSGEAK